MESRERLEMPDARATDAFIATLKWRRIGAAAAAICGSIGFVIALVWALGAAPMAPAGGRGRIFGFVLVAPLLGLAWVIGHALKCPRCRSGLSLVPEKPDRCERCGLRLS